MTCVDGIADRRGFQGVRILKGVPENNRGRDKDTKGKKSSGDAALPVTPLIPNPKFL